MYWDDFKDQEMLKKLTSFVDRLGQDDSNRAYMLSIIITRKVGAMLLVVYSIALIHRGILKKVESKRISMNNGTDATKKPPPRPILPRSVICARKLDGMGESNATLPFLKQPSFAMRDKQILLTFQDIDPLELARQLTLIESKYFQNIKVRCML